MSDLATEHVLGRRSYGKNTQTAGTIIKQLVEPWPNAWTRITGYRQTVSTTAHLLTLMRPFNLTTFSADAAAAQAVVNITADPGAYSAAGALATANNLIAANDWVVYEAADGTFVMDVVSSVSTLAITLTANLPTGGVKKNGKFWFFGIATDTNPNNNQANPRWNAAASTLFTLSRADALGSIPDHPLLNLGKGRYQPLILQIDNGTAASTMESVGVEYVRKAAA